MAAAWRLHSRWCCVEKRCTRGLNVKGEKYTGPDRPRRVLFLSYMFPPVGGGGVQRSLKFVKYLPASGWMPTILTVRPIAYYVYDPELIREVPPGAEIIRTGSADPLRMAGILLRNHRNARRAIPQRRVKIVEGSTIVKAYRALRRVLF